MAEPFGACWAVAILFAAVVGCSPREDPRTQEAELEERAASSLRARDHCAAADALLRLASHYESHSRWSEAHEAAQRGIDVWQVAPTLDFLIRERDRARIGGHDDAVADFERKIAEGMRSAALAIAPKSDPACEANPPSIGLVSARLKAARTALRASKLPAAQAQLERLRYEIAHGIVHAAPDEERELERVSARSSSLLVGPGEGPGS